MIIARCTCYHPLFVFNQFGDLERCMLRPGNVHSAGDWRSVLVPVIARYRGRGLVLYFRGDAAFAKPEVYELLEAEDIGYAIRLPANCVLQERIAHLLTRPVGRPPKKPQDGTGVLSLVVRPAMHDRMDMTITDQTPSLERGAPSRPPPRSRSRPVDSHLPEHSWWGVGGRGRESPRPLCPAGFGPPGGSARHVTDDSPCSSASAAPKQPGSPLSSVLHHR